MNITIYRDGKQLGPFTSGQVRQMLDTGLLSESAHYWHEGLVSSQPLSAFGEQRNGVSIATEDPIQVSAKYDEVGAVVSEGVSTETKGSTHVSAKSDAAEPVTVRSAIPDAVVSESSHAAFKEYLRTPPETRIVSFVSLLAAKVSASHASKVERESENSARSLLYRQHQFLQISETYMDKAPWIPFLTERKHRKTMTRLGVTIETFPTFEEKELFERVSRLATNLSRKSASRLDAATQQDIAHLLADQTGDFSEKLQGVYEAEQARRDLAIADRELSEAKKLYGRYVGTGILLGLSVCLLPFTFIAGLDSSFRLWGFIASIVGIGCSIPLMTKYGGIGTIINALDNRCRKLRKTARLEEDLDALKRPLLQLQEDAATRVSKYLAGI